MLLDCALAAYPTEMYITSCMLATADIITGLRDDKGEAAGRNSGRTNRLRIYL